MNTTAYILIGIGLFISSMSVVGLMRFPDIYTRLHAATKTTTFGSIFIVAGIIVRNFANYDNASIIIMVHALLALLVIIFTNPISAHAIARAALLSGVKPFGVKINEFDEQQKTTRKEKQS